MRSVECYFFFIFLFSLSSCFEPQNGCLDVGATNYSIYADDRCNGCCEYPELRIDFQHKVVLPDTILNLNFSEDVYTDGVGNSFKINDLQYYLTDFRFVREDGTELSVEDTVSVTLNNGSGGSTTEVIEDNFALIDPASFAVPVMGTFRENGAFTAVRFNIGINATADQADPETFEDSHPLSATNGMYDSERQGYVFNRIELITDVNVDSIVSVVEIGTAPSLVSVEIPTPDLFLEPGFNIQTVLFVDYLRWFSTANVLSEDKELLSRQIVDQIADSFSLVEIILN